MRRRPTRPAGRGDTPGPRSIPISKPGGGTRWLTVLDPADDVAYRAVVSPLVGRIERSLGPEVVAIRARPQERGWTLAPWWPARASWRGRLEGAILDATRGTTFAVADVRDCYASISPETIRALLGPESADVVALLRGLHERGVRGLPVGPESSAVLANAALSRLDRAIRAPALGTSDGSTTSSCGVRPTRSGPRWPRCGSAGDALRLDLHRDKTRVLEDRDEAVAALLGDRDSSIIAAP